MKKGKYKDLKEIIQMVYLGIILWILIGILPNSVVKELRKYSQLRSLLRASVWAVDLVNVCNLLKKRKKSFYTAAWFQHDLSNTFIKINVPIHTSKMSAG